MLSGEKVVRALERVGWRRDRLRGSHVVMVMLREGLNVSLSVPQHSELAPGTLRSLIRLSGMTVAQFLELL